MAVNLVRNYTREEAHHLLNSSFAQFLADRGVVTLERELERDQAFARRATASRCAATGATSPSTGRLAGARASSSGEEAAPGPGASPSGRAARRVARAAAGRRDPASRARRRRGLAVVVSQPRRDGRRCSPQDRRFFRASARATSTTRPPVLARIDLPRSRERPAARGTAATWPRGWRRCDGAAAAAPGGRGADPKAEARGGRAGARGRRSIPATPARTGPKHERWAARALEARARHRGLDRRIRVADGDARRGSSTACWRCWRSWATCEDFALDGRRASAARGSTARATSWSAEALGGGLFDGLSPAELAALVSTPGVRVARAGPAAGAQMPTDGAAGPVRASCARLWRRDPPGRGRSTGGAVPRARRRVRGARSSTGPRASRSRTCWRRRSMAPGDFVRNCKQLLDLLRQIEDVAPPEAAGARPPRHARRVLRGVVAYTGVCRMRA